MTKGNKLREILSEPGILVLPGVHDCLSVKLTEKIGFKVAFTSGFGISASMLGKPDFGFLNATEMLWSVSRIISSVDIPVVVDIDTGYGNALNVMSTVSEVVKIGGAGIILEDQDWPKKCGHFDGKSVISMSEHVEKIHAAKEARKDSGLIIIGRTDSRASLGLDEAIKRGNSYYEAGADIVFIEAPQSKEELKEIASAFSDDVPLFANMVEGGKTPFLSSTELEELGYKIVVYPLAGLFSATKALESCFNHLKENGTTLGFEDMLDFKEFEDVIDTPSYRELESKFKTDS
ncbi:MAG: oxaloacetate decarboxylase [Thermodesulfobacteriota bacterium]